MTGRSQTQITCAYCGCLAYKPTSEVARIHRKKKRTFCSCSCSAKASNLARKAKSITIDCPVCSLTFETSTLKRAAKHCSRVCASKGSVTPKRRDASIASGYHNRKNLLSVVDCLKRREAWKYAELKESLGDCPHEFEYGLEGYVFDLALFSTKTLVEFDGKHHRQRKQLRVDAAKEKVAIEAGFTLIRYTTTSAGVIPSDILDGIK